MNHVIETIVKPVKTQLQGFGVPGATPCVVCLSLMGGDTAVDYEASDFPPFPNAFDAEAYLVHHSVIRKG